METTPANLKYSQYIFIYHTTLGSISYLGGGGGGEGFSIRGGD